MGGNACILLHPLTDSKLQALAGFRSLLQALASSWLEEFKIRGSTFHDLGKRDRASFGT